MTAKVTHEQLERFLNTCYERKRACFCWGTMGIGKSDAVRSVAKSIAKKNGMGFLEGEPDGKENFGFVDARISQFEPSDLRGLPVVDLQKQFTKWLVANWLPQNKDSKGILFFDEINLAPASIQASCYQLILDRKLLDYRLPEGWVIFSAGNTIDDRANVFDLPAPLANRFVHVELGVPSKEEWSRWALMNDIDIQLVSFMEFKPSYLHKFDKKMKDKAFPTPRSIAFCSQLIKDNECSDEDKTILVASAVGEAFATEFMAFLKLQKKINLKELLEKPQKVKDITEIDLKYSLLGAVVEKYKEDKKVLEKVLNICNYLEPEFAILLLRYLKASKEEFKTEVTKVKIWQDLAGKYAKYLLDLRND